MSLKPQDDEELYRLYEAHMRNKDMTLSMKISYPELLLDAICSSREAKRAGKARLIARWPNRKDDSQQYSIDTSALGTLRRVAASVESRRRAASGGVTLTAPILGGMPAPVLVP